MNWGIIGFGNVVKNRFLPAMIATKQTIAALLVKEDFQKITKLRSSIRAKVTTDQNDFFNTDMDAVYIASPPSTHVNYTFLSLQRKINVLCEKPLSLIPWVTDKLIKEAKESKLALMENFPCFKHVIWDFVKKSISDHPGKVHMSMSFGAPMVPYGWRLIPNEFGCFCDFAVYAPAMFIFLTGKVPYCPHMASGMSVNGVLHSCIGTLVEDNFALQFATGYNLQFNSSATLWDQSKTTIISSNAFNPRTDELPVLVQSGDSPSKQVNFFKYDAWNQTLIDFEVACLDYGAREQAYEICRLQSLATHRMLDRMPLGRFLHAYTGLE